MAPSTNQVVSVFFQYRTCRAPREAKSRSPSRPPAPDGSRREVRYRTPWHGGGRGGQAPGSGARAVLVCRPGRLTPSPSGRSSGQAQDGGAPDVARGEIAQRQVCVLEADRSRRDLDPESLRQDQELLAVTPGVAR